MCHLSIITLPEVGHAGTGRSLGPSSLSGASAAVENGWWVGWPTHHPPASQHQLRVLGREECEHRALAVFADRKPADVRNVVGRPDHRTAELPDLPGCAVAV